MTFSKNRNARMQSDAFWYPYYSTDIRNYFFTVSWGACTQCTERSQAADHQVKEVKSVHIVQIVKNKMFINIFHL